MGLYYMPTKILAGQGIINKQSSVFKGFGKKALIVTGKHSSKVNGSLKDVEEALQKEAIDYIIFDEVEENPSFETVEKAAKKGIQESVNFVVGIGGGSPIDAAKAIAVMIKNPDLRADTLMTSKVLEAIDVISVPTTAGTGTETTQYAILTDHKMQTKRNLGQTVFPKVSFLDASYMEEMPIYVTRSTAIDALSHLVESYLSRKAHLLTDTLAESGIRLWGECLEALKEDSLTIEHREKLMIASTIGGMVIANTGTSLPHGMGYYLTYFKDVPHGIANGILYKAYLECFKNQEKVQKIHKLLGLESHEKFIEDLYTLIDLNVEIEEGEMIKWTKLMYENKAKLMNHPEPISEEELFTIFKESLVN